jgi:voltage-dependent calcium channel
MSSKFCRYSRTDTLPSLEAFARTCVSGLILDPDVPISAIFTSLFMHNPGHPITGTPIIHPAAMGSTRSSTNLSRKGTLFHRLQTFYGNATRPFALSSSTGYTSSSVGGATSAAASSATLISPASLGRKRPDSTPIPLEKTTSSSSTIVPTYSSQQQETLGLPFQFSMNLARDITRRNLPYLRHSWTRIDALSVIAFWITFILAQTGIERGNHHIGLFRALSVLRTARLLSITSGTTVSWHSMLYHGASGAHGRPPRQTIMHSLKIARPLLASVAYFVLFAVTLFSYVHFRQIWTWLTFPCSPLHRIIGIQSFKGSLRRSCYLEPTLGEPETLLTHQCGGYIDPGNFSVMPFITQDGRTVQPKGYICPLGQVCKVCPDISLW